MAVIESFLRICTESVQNWIVQKQDRMPLTRLCRRGCYKKCWHDLVLFPAKQVIQDADYLLPVWVSILIQQGRWILYTTILHVHLHTAFGVYKHIYFGI